MVPSHVISFALISTLKAYTLQKMDFLAENCSCTSLVPCIHLCLVCVCVCVCTGHLVHSGQYGRPSSRSCPVCTCRWCTHAPTFSRTWYATARSSTRNTRQWVHLSSTLCLGMTYELDWAFNTKCSCYFSASPALILFHEKRTRSVHVGFIKVLKTWLWAASSNSS